MKKWLGLILSVAVICIDQASKFWVASSLLPYQPKAILPMFNLTLAYNTGSAFSFLSQTGQWHQWFFAGFSLCMSIVLLVWIIRLPQQARQQLLALCLILGGALGNLFDRVRLGHVIDFIQVYYKTHYWPVFNIADSAICIGALLLLIDMVRHQND